MKKKYTLKEIIQHARRLYSLRVVRGLWTHWFNPLYTLYINFIFFPFHQAIYLPVFVYGWPKLFSQYGRMECKGVCKTGMIRLNFSMGGTPQYTVGNTELNIWGKIIFRGQCIIGGGNKIIVGDHGLLDIGNSTKIANFCNITAYSTTHIGAHSRIAHRCQILDTNFHYIADFKKNIVKRSDHPITIGEYCWICNSTSVTGGAVIPDKTIVSSNSLVNKDMSSIPMESIIGGIPAKLISTGHRRIESRKLGSEVGIYFKEHPETETYFLGDNINHNICDVDDDKHLL